MTLKRAYSLEDLGVLPRVLRDWRLHYLLYYS
jgi:hypothetical protein